MRRRKNEEATKMNGKISIIEKGGAKLHTYTSPEDGLLVNTHIIETKDKLVVIDTQLLRKFAKEAKGYVESLAKPIDRIIITHSHPDHWFGLEYFEGVPTYSLKETKEEIEKMGAMFIDAEKKMFGDEITDKIILLKNEIKEGAETIDGVKFEFEKVGGAEAGVQLLIKLPELSAIIVQDIASNCVHLFTGEKAFDSWIKILSSLKKFKGYDRVLVGHGEPADSSVYDKNIAYLECAKSAFKSAKNGDELKKKLLEKFPDWRVTTIIDISNVYLYKGDAK